MIGSETPANDASTPDLVHFENVRDTGIIETPTTYSMLVEVTPREWLTISDEQRSNLYVDFLTYLRGLEFPTQFLTLTTRFDADDYYEQFVGPDAPGASTQATSATRPREASEPLDFDAASEDVIDADSTANATNTAASAEDGPAADVDAAADPTADGDGDGTAAGKADDETGAAPTDAAADTPATDGGTASASLIIDSPLLGYGRHTHTQWLKQIISGGDVRDRHFIVAVGVEKGDYNEEDGSRVDPLRELLPVRSTSSQAVTNEDAYLDEVRTRAHRVAAKLPRTEVTAEVLTSRRNVLGVLYQSYRGHEAPISLDRAVLTKPEASTLTDPSTGDPLDLEAAFDEADRAPDPTADEYPDRPGTHSTASLPEASAAGGNVHPEFADRVANNRFLAWYARHIAPIGRGPEYSTPNTVYGGVVMFVLGLLMGASAYGLFAISNSPPASVAAQVTPLVLRELAYGLAAASLPVFLLSLVVLLPSGRVAQAAGTLGVAVTGGAIGLFARAFPHAWNTVDLTQTITVLQVYGVGLLLLIIAVALAVRSRRLALESEPAGAGDEPAPDGGIEPGEQADAQPSHPDGGPRG